MDVLAALAIGAGGLVGSVLVGVAIASAALALSVVVVLWLTE